MNSARTRIAGLLLMAAMLAVGCFLFFRPGSLPGNDGDTRFNQYVLEHGYLWLTGRVPAFWDAPFFFPARNVIAYSDSHLGTLPIYALFRFLAFDRDAALANWFFACCVLNFLSAAWALNRLRLPAFAVASGAFLFTFGLPVTDQFGHLQLVPRFFVPLAFHAAIRLMETRLPRYWLALVALGIAQLYVSIYTGFFLGLCVAALMVGWAWSQRSRAPGRQRWPFTRSDLPSWRTGALTIALVLLLLPLAIPHYQASQVLGTRGWGEVSSMLPRASSYLRAPGSLTWAWLLPDTSGLPMAHEHVLFVGVLPLLAIAWLALGRKTGSHWSGDRGRVLVRALLVGITLVVIVTLMVGKVSLYRLLLPLPGVGGIRAVTRIIVVMIYPVAMLLAIAMAQSHLRVTQRWRHPALGAGLAAALMIACVMDQRSSVATFSMAQAKALLVPVKAAMSGSGKSPFWYQGPPEDPAYKSHLSAMLVGQELGIATVNGYSGNCPPGFPWTLCVSGADPCAALLQWRSANAFAFKREDVASNLTCPPARVLRK